MDKMMFFGMGLPSQIVKPCVNAPEGSAREQMELEKERDYHGLCMDIQSVLYLHQRGIRVAC
jgi:hypothetical protein